MDKRKHFLFLLIITLLCQAELRATQLSMVPSDEMQALESNFFTKPPLERSGAFKGIELLEACGQSESGKFAKKEKTELSFKQQSNAKFPRTRSYNFNREDDRKELGETKEEFSKGFLVLTFGKSYKENLFYKQQFEIGELTEEKLIKNSSEKKEELSEEINVSAAKEAKSEEGMSESL